MKIRLTQDAYISSGEYRLHTEDGKPSIYVLREWYEAAATDEDGNDYLVVWRIDPDDSDACDWDTPAEITQLSTGGNVTRTAKIEGVA